MILVNLVSLTQSLLLDQMFRHSMSDTSRVVNALAYPVALLPGRFHCRPKGISSLHLSQQPFELRHVRQCLAVETMDRNLLSFCTQFVDGLMIKCKRLKSLRSLKLRMCARENIHEFHSNQLALKYAVNGNLFCLCFRSPLLSTMLYRWDRDCDKNSGHRPDRRDPSSPLRARQIGHEAEVIHA